MIGWFDANSGFIVSIAALCGLIAMTGVVRRYIVPIKKLVEAQLTTNGGGSLVDKTNRILPNHAEAQKHWGGLEVGQTQLNLSISEIKTQISGFASKQAEILEKQERGRIALEAAFAVAPEVQRKAVEEAIAKLAPLVKR